MPEMYSVLCIPSLPEACDPRGISSPTFIDLVSRILLDEVAHLA